ncbi:MAG TPA: radical SAM protein, partial [Candidatus Sulfotelmatobacter sp.]|nr:radical SAM protein [Candidatus Sulfotelmatobacter sp.]
MPRYHVQNFGCRATQADGAALERQFEERGLVESSASEADIVVLNTCTVTAAADQDARAAIRRVRRNNPKARIVVTGCYAQRASDEIAALPGVSAVVGNSHKHQLAELIVGNTSGLAESSGSRAAGNSTADQTCDSGWRSASSAAISPLAAASASAAEERAFIPLTLLTAQPLKQSAPTLDQQPIYVSDIFAHTELLAAPVFDAPNDRTRPNLKIQDGCDNRCSFCVIPYVRGQSRSLPVDQILAEVNTLVDAGYREIVLSGINLGRWGREAGFRPPASGFSEVRSQSEFQALPESRKRGAPLLASFARSGIPKAGSRTPTFEDLIQTILDQTQIEKIRISSVEPMDWSDELINLVATSPRIAKHAHVPMQSGSDAVLRRMHRKYRPWHYREKIEKIRAAMPTAAIGADVMVGFPGETDAEFEATRRMIEDLPFTYLHVFTYSARPGTPAAVMRNQV